MSFPKQEGISIDEVIYAVEEEREKIDDADVFFALKKYRLNKIYSATVDTVAYCIALDRLGLRITVNLLQHLRKVSYNSTLAILHHLGDKEVLTFLRFEGGRNYHQWILNTGFKKTFKRRCIENA